MFATRLNDMFSYLDKTSVLSFNVKLIVISLIMVCKGRLFGQNKKKIAKKFSSRRLFKSFKQQEKQKFPIYFLQTHSQCYVLRVEKCF